MAPRHQANTTDADVADRFVKLGGCFNVRDLGGYPAADGRVVRRGRIYRADALDRLTAAGRAGLAALGINTVIDLRQPRSWQPEPPWPGRRQHIPLRAATPNWDGLTTTEAADPDLAVAHYRDTVQQGGPAWQPCSPRSPRRERPRRSASSAPDTDRLLTHATVSSGRLSEL